MSVLETNEHFEEFRRKRYDYIHAVYIKSVEKLDSPDVDYDPYTQRLQDATHSSINFKYIQTSVDLKYDTFKEAIKNDNYIDNECWINSIYDFYKDTLMNENKRNRLTREIILEDIGKTEETIKSGISINDILPFFKKYNLFLRVFDSVGKIICRHDPDRSNHNNKRMYCMVKNNHVYTMNYNLAELSKKLEDDELIKVMKPTGDFYIKPNAEPKEFVMIETIDDLIMIYKANAEER